ncbi:hypothetical protein CKO42_17340 [Lamprobacter modestohalophilus]|uniref:Uncharacterized protein n=1 Tax=Lamprobacter modestohalophilus TaxID=1064514 RepID=A0A9X0WAP7_9GAMM|nr:hypothetical protein [Lamprobacter modestohalophilus]MBK1620172.1 hypothetical protein [Lamprobacter modestohalophilus]
MTLRQRDALSSLQDELFQLDHACRRLSRKAKALGELLEPAAADEDAFTPEEVERLVQLNERLAFLARHLQEVGQTLCPQMEARVADPDDPMVDFEIEAILHFMFPEDDPDYDEDSDPFLTKRSFNLKVDHNEGREGVDYRESVHRFPGRLNQIAHCWLFHDLYDHSYGLEQPALSLVDCLRIDKIWVTVAVEHQATLDIETGAWLPDTI